MRNSSLQLSYITSVLAQVIPNQQQTCLFASPLLCISHPPNIKTHRTHTWNWLAYGKTTQSLIWTQASKTVRNPPLVYSPVKRENKIPCLFAHTMLGHCKLKPYFNFPMMRLENADKHEHEQNIHRKSITSMYLSTFLQPTLKDLVRWFFGVHHVIYERFINEERQS